jgi:hypothetical protein
MCCTTLSILGFVPTKAWEQILAASIAESFFGAICRGNLEVEIEGGPSINAATLPDVFADANIVSVIADQKEEPETFVNSGHFLRTLTSDERQTEETQNASLGHCRLHILVGEGLPKRIITQKCHNEGINIAEHEEYLIAERLMKSPFQLVEAYVFKGTEV